MPSQLSKDEESVGLDQPALRRTTPAFAKPVFPAPSPASERDAGKAYCDDCSREYGHEHGFPDLIIPNAVWRRISPTKDNGGLLCPSCICKRLHDIGIQDCEAAFMSGPIKTVDRTTMENLRWIENLKEQGHGWSCPSCGDGREQASERDAGWKWPEWLTAPWIAMDRQGYWSCFGEEPHIDSLELLWNGWQETFLHYPGQFAFTPPPCTDWRESKRRNPSLVPPSAPAEPAAGEAPQSNEEARP